MRAAAAFTLACYAGLASRVLAAESSISGLTVATCLPLGTIGGDGVRGKFLPFWNAELKSRDGSEECCLSAYDGAIRRLIAARLVPAGHEKPVPYIAAALHRNL